MINLIPPGAKKQVRKEYWIRVVSVWMALAASAFVMIAVLHVPTYVLIQNQLAVFENKFNEANTQNESFKEAESTVSQANQVARLLADEEETTSFTTLLEVFETLAGTKVEINSFNFTKTDGVIASISISGQAQTRQSLVAFSDAVELNKLFESAKIPLSSLAKDKDIPFSITVIPNRISE